MPSRPGQTAIAEIRRPSASSISRLAVAAACLLAAGCLAADPGDSPSVPTPPRFCEAPVQCPAPFVRYSEGLGLELELEIDDVGIFVRDVAAMSATEIFDTSGLSSTSLLVGITVHTEDCSFTCVAPEPCRTSICTNWSSCYACIDDDVASAAQECLSQCGS